MLAELIIINLYNQTYYDFLLINTIGLTKMQSPALSFSSAASHTMQITSPANHNSGLLMFSGQVGGPAGHPVSASVF